MHRTACYLLFIMGILTYATAGCIPPGEQLKDQPIPQAAPLEKPSEASNSDLKGGPGSFQVKFETTKGDFVVEVNRAWSPNGADRFLGLVKSRFYDDCAFFRVLPGFMAQTGINGDPEIQAKWRDANIKDDSVVKSNLRGYVTFAKSGLPNSRSTQIFINFGNNARLDKMGFSPFGRVVEGMDVVDKINAKYGETPDQSDIQYKGNEYLKKNFPGLDYIKTARILENETEKEGAKSSDKNSEGQK